MAWPPSIPPTNRTNATPQQDTHPADHNAIAAALAEIVARFAVEIGQIIIWGSAPFPGCYLECNGQAVPGGDQYATLRGLYANVPDLRDKFIYGAGSKGIGTVGGAEVVTLTPAQMPVHAHPLSEVFLFDAGVAGVATQTHSDNGGPNAHWGLARQPGRTTDNAGGNSAHENMPPYVVMRYLMRATT